MWSVKLAGAFSAYDRDVSAKIEESFQENSSGECRFVLRGNDYTIDFAAMKQRQTSDSSKVRVVKRSAAPTPALVPAPGAPVPIPATAPAPAPAVPAPAAKTKDGRACHERDSKKRRLGAEDLAASSSAAALPRAPAAPAAPPAAAPAAAPTPVAAAAASTAAPPPAARQQPAGKRPSGPSFLGGTDRCAGTADVARSTIDTSQLHVEAADDALVFRGTGVGNEALRQVIHLAGNNLPAPNEHIPGRAPSSDSLHGHQRGVVMFEGGPKRLNTVLHAETRAVLHAAAASLAASNAVRAAELRTLAEQDYKSQTGALLYDAGVKLTMHLDDILACNRKAMDARNMLWNLGNDATFELLSAPAGVTRLPPERHKTQGFQRDPARVKKVLLRHGDAILINIEQVAHGVRVEQSCADADAARLLPGRRMCVSVRPVLVAESPNVAGYVFDGANQQWENPHHRNT